MGQLLSMLGSSWHLPWFLHPYQSWWYRLEERLIGPEKGSPPNPVVSPSLHPWMFHVGQGEDFPFT